MHGGFINIVYLDRLSSQVYISSLIEACKIMFLVILKQKHNIMYCNIPLCKRTPRDLHPKSVICKRKGAVNTLREKNGHRLLHSGSHD